MTWVPFTSVSAAEKAIENARVDIEKVTDLMNLLRRDRGNRKFFGFGGLKTETIKEIALLDRQLQAIANSIKFTDDEWRHFRQRMARESAAAPVETAAAVSTMRPLRFRTRTPGMPKQF